MSAREAMESDSHDEPESPHRPDIERLKISEYYLNPAAHIDEETRMAALETLARNFDTSSETALSAVAEFFCLRMEWSRLELLHVLTLTGCTPELAFAGAERADAARYGLFYLRSALEHYPVPPRPQPIRSL